MTDSAEELFDALDNAWSSGSGMSVSRLLTKVPLESVETAVELCAADLEWRYRSDSDQACFGLPCRPQAADYAKLLAEFSPDERLRKNLLEAEWCARSLWGDAPDIDQFAQQFAHQIAGDESWREELAEQLCTLAPMYGTLASPSLKHGCSLILSSNFCVGRQSRDEPPAPTWNPKNNRLIVANSHYRVISRDQLQVRRTRRREVELKNVSSSIGGVWGKHPLGPGQSQRLRLPCEIGIGEMTLSIRCGTDGATTEQASEAR